ncbi:unnamed protein product [Zymoseptoria tritici ST99CH_1E4]|nr:unnamed protein product [Zymoseptoria tritici ST99CH_1E4]
MAEAIETPIPGVRKFPGCLDEEDMLAELKVLDEKRLAEFPYVQDEEFPDPKPKLKEGERAMVIEYEVEQLIKRAVDEDEDQYMPPELIAYLTAELFKGFQHIGMVLNEKYGTRGSADVAQRKVFTALAYGRGIPECYRTAFYWFRDRYLGGAKYEEDGFDGVVKRELAAGRIREKKWKRGEGFK